MNAHEWVEAYLAAGAEIARLMGISLVDGCIEVWALLG